MSAVSNALTGVSDQGLSSILAQLNTLLTPTEKLPGSPNPTGLLLGLNSTPVAHAAAVPALSGASGAPSQPSTVSSILQGLGKAKGPISKIAQSLLGTPISAADAATWASGAPANSAVSQALGSNASQSTVGGAAQAGNDAALAGLSGSLADYASGAMADNAVTAALGTVGEQTAGESAAIQAANDAALNATDGGAAGASAGLESGALSDAGTALGAAGSAYSLYNTIKNYQSGATGPDALNGAETGASIGGMFGPIGMLVGGLIGGAVGGVASAFGGGKNDPETLGWNQVAGAYNKNPGVLNSLTPAELYQNLAGVMDAKDNSPGHSQPIEQVFGRMGEQNLMDQLTGYLNQQYQAGKITPGESIANQWSQTINPWLQSKNAGIANNNTSTGNPEGPALTADLQGLVQDWESGLYNSSTPMGIAGQPIAGIASYLGGPKPAAPQIPSAVAAFLKQGSLGNLGAFA